MDRTLQFLSESGRQNEALEIVQSNKNAKGIPNVGSYIITDRDYEL